MIIHSEKEKIKVKPIKERPIEDWMSKKWRPMMGWLYMGTCTFDFIIFPIIWSILQALMNQDVTQWNPITLQGAGLYHLSMGAICGVAAWSRGKEKLAILDMGGDIDMRHSSNLTRTSKTSLPNTDNEDADNMIRKK